MNMKKLFTICALLMMSLLLRAQYSSVMAYDANISSNGHAVVRNMSTTEVITYVMNSGINNFTYENNSSLTYNYVKLLPNIRVMDLRIFSGKAYFCGVNNTTNLGVLGTFDATLLQSVPNTVPIDYFDVPSISVLTRLEVYKDLSTGNPRVAAVGYDDGNACGVWACGRVVDCADFWPGSMTATITMGNSYYGGMYDIEQWFDVVATEDWVVLVGYGIMGGQSGLMLRRFPKSNPMDPTEVDNMYFYKLPEIVSWEEVRGVFLKENDIAVVYRGPRDNNVTDYTDFRIFNISTMKNINSQEYVIPYKSYIWEMAYMEHADRVVVLDNFPSPVYMSNFVYLVPYRTVTYPSVYVNEKEWEFQSVTNLDGDYFVGAGCMHFLLRDATAAYPAYNIFSPDPYFCPADNELRVEIIKDIEPTIFYEPIVNPFPAQAPIPLQSQVDQGTMDVRCISQ